MQFILSQPTETLKEKCPTVANFGFNIADTIRFHASDIAGTLADFTTEVMVVVYKTGNAVRVVLTPGSPLLGLEATGEKPNAEEWRDLELLVTTYMNVESFQEIVYEGTREQVQKRGRKALEN